MIHPGLAALKQWDREEYAAGYRARFCDIPDFEAAHHCWHCGWEDADTEALDPFGTKRLSLRASQITLRTPGANLFDTGEEARANDIPFDPERTEPWKEGWVAVDIRLGMLAEQGHL